MFGRMSKFEIFIVRISFGLSNSAMNNFYGHYNRIYHRHESCVSARLIYLLIETINQNLAMHAYRRLFDSSVYSSDQGDICTVIVKVIKKKSCALNTGMSIFLNHGYSCIIFQVWLEIEIELWFSFTKYIHRHWSLLL